MAMRVEADYTFTPIADSAGPFSDFGSVSSPSLNGEGTVGFFAVLDNGTSGVFKGSGGNITTIGINSDPFGFLRTVYPVINDAGMVAFLAFQWNGVSERILAGNGGPLTTIAETNGQFRGFAGLTAIDTVGTVAFWASQDAGPSGIFGGNGGAATPILFGSTSLPVDPGVSLNDVGTIAFRTGDGTGIATFNGGVITMIAESSGTLNYFGSGPSLNGAGTVAFVAGVGGIDGGTFGIYKGNGGPLTTIADASGPFSSFGTFNSGYASINDAGYVAFLGRLDAGGVGIYLGDGSEPTEVISYGDPLFGSTVTSLSMSPTSLNDDGQVAFYYGLANGTTGIAVANPIPEPSSAFLLALSLGLNLARRPTRKC